MKKKELFYDTHCGGTSEPYYAVIDEHGKEIGHFVKEYPYHDTHCGGTSEPYDAVIDEHGKEIGHFAKEYPYHDSHCGKAPQHYNVFISQSDNFTSEDIKSLESFKQDDMQKSEKPLALKFQLRIEK